MRQVLFTSSFRIKVKRAMEVFALIALINLGVCFLNYIYQEPDYASRIMWKSFYAQDDVDTIFLGSSHVYCDVDVYVVDEVMNCKSFDMATSSQRLQESYYNLIEANQKYDIKNVYVELYYEESTDKDGDYKTVNAMKNSWKNTDYMGKGFVWLEGVWKMNDSEHLLDALMPFVRYRAYLFDWDYISEQISIKKSDDYKNYKYHYDFSENGFYEIDLNRKGFWYSTKIIDDFIYTPSREKCDMCMTNDAEKYLKKIIEYCHEHEISLKLFVSPIYETQLISTEGGYDTYLNYVQALADEYSIPFYDFNIIKKEYLKLDTDDFYDVGHLNSKGAEKFTRILCDVFSNENLDKNMYFYDSFSEKMQNEIPRLYGIYWVNKNDRVIKIAASDNSNMEFKVVFEQIDDESLENNTSSNVMLQDYNKNREIIIPKVEHGKIIIYWRMKNSEENVEMMEIMF